MEDDCFDARDDLDEFKDELEEEFNPKFTSESKSEESDAHTDVREKTSRREKPRADEDMFVGEKDPPSKKKQSKLEGDPMVPPEQNYSESGSSGRLINVGAGDGERERQPRQPYIGGRQGGCGGRGGYSNWEGGGDFERPPQRMYEWRSGIGHGNEIKRDGYGHGN